MDIRLYNRTGAYAVRYADTEEMEASGLGASPTSDIETLANKVIKFFLTPYGSDEYDPSYGSRVFSYTQISKSFLPKLKIELNRDVQRCIAFIRQGETKDTSCRLGTIKVRSVDYDPTLPDTLHIRLECVAADRTSVILDL